MRKLFQPASFEEETNILNTWDEEQKTRLFAAADTFGLLKPLFRGFSALHVAGTNGKGSLSTMVSCVLTAAGYKTGLFTSPHMYEENERIKVDGACIPQARLTKDLDEIYLRYPDLRLFDGYFDSAIRYFCEERVDFAVMEVGVGGRMDCTNLIIPDVCAIATIGLDHCDILGDTMEQVAYEKAGIAKPNIPLCLYPMMDPTAREVILKRCEAIGTPVVEYAKGEYTITHLGGGRYTISVSRPNLKIQNLSVPLLGEHQGHNAALALIVIETLMGLGYEITQEHIRKGFAMVRHPGRMEQIASDPVTVLDGAHNEEGALAAAAAIKKAYPHAPIILLTAMMSNKDAAKASAALGAVADAVICTRVDTPRAMDAAVLAALYGEKAVAISDPKEAYAHAKAICPEGGVVFVAGSLYLPSAIL